MEKVTIGNAELYCGDCMDLMKSMPDNSIDTIITDPPYFWVKDEDWDKQWENPIKFLAWVALLVEQFERILKSNGSLYFFASSKMASLVEVEISKRLNILNNITWRKGQAGMKANAWSNKAEKEALRAFIYVTEKIIFAEHYNSDNVAKGESGYVAKCNKLRGFIFEPLRKYLREGIDAAGWSPAQLNKAMGFVQGGMANHYFSRSQWQLPTEAHYKTMRDLVGAEHFWREYESLRIEYESLRIEYESLRSEYESLRIEYESLRRPFNVSAKDQWGDVWEFDPVQYYLGKHPCEKPLLLLMHILKASTRPGAVVFDPFTGSGSMGHACHEMGRQFIGVEKCPTNFVKAVQRIEAVQAQSRLTI